MRRALWAAGWIVVALAGCATSAELRQAPTAREVPGKEHAAYAVSSGIRVVAEAGAWRNSDITSEVTPIRVTITNESGRPVLLRYREFMLIDQTGERYAALPPYRITDASAQRALSEQPSIADPQIAFEGFDVAPYYDEIYPSINVGGTPAMFDPDYYSTYAMVSLPTKTMQRRALPEGQLRDGGQVTGFLYFRHLDPYRARTVTLRTQFVQAPDGNLAATISIPFRVADQG